MAVRPVIVGRVAVQRVAVRGVAVRQGARAFPILNDGLGIGATEAEAVDTDTTRGSLRAGGPGDRLGRNAQVRVIWSILGLSLLK